MPPKRSFDDLTGKTALITGGGRGIGRAVALAYARAGARVAICARTEAELAETRGEIEAAGGNAVAIPCDVSQPAQVERMVRQALEEFGRIDVLVNNAGISGPEGPLANVAIEDWDAVLHVNLRGAFLCARAVLPHRMERRQGSIINVSSWLGRDSTTGWGPYGVSKWGLEGLTRYLATEGRSYRIRVNSVSPGFVATRLTKYRGADPDSVVDLFIYLASDASRGITGRALDVERWRFQVRQ